MRVIRTLYDGGTERTTSTVTSMGCDLMGAQGSAEGAETPLPSHVACFWRWWCCFGSAAHAGSMIEAGIAVNMLGKALYMEPGGSRMAGLWQGWEGACSSHNDLG